MGGYADKVQKSAGGVLRPGERVISAIRTQPSGTAIATGVGGLVGQAVAGKQAAKAQAGAAEGSMAQGWATGRFAVALTDQRLLTFNYTAMGKPKDLTTEHPLSDIAAVEKTPKKLTQGVRFSFADGSAAEVECAKLEKVGDFVSAFESVKAGTG